MRPITCIAVGHEHLVLLKEALKHRDGTGRAQRLNSGHDAGAQRTQRGTNLAQLVRERVYVQALAVQAQRVDG